MITIKEMLVINLGAGMGIDVFTGQEGKPGAKNWAT
jgi:hypothetical protein